MLPIILVGFLRLFLYLGGSRGCLSTAEDLEAAAFPCRILEDVSLPGGVLESSSLLLGFLEAAAFPCRVLEAVSLPGVGGSRGCLSIAGGS
jgi:hypothetical protein